MVGELGDDVLVGGAGSDFLHAGAGNDTLTGGSENDYFNMRDGGHDAVTDFSLGDTLDLSGFPSLTTRAALEGAAQEVGPDVVITIDATSSITLRNFTLGELATANVIFAPFVGTEGNDVLNGTDGGEVIDGLGGDDVINGFGGGDSLFGGAGNDTLDGGADGDFVVGGSGNDTLLGGDGNDTLEGGSGDDSLTGGADLDFFRMQSGHDTITDFSPTDVLDLSGIPTMTSRAALTAAAQEVGSDVEITTGPGDVITLQNFTLAELAASEVRFAPFVGTEGDDVLNGTDGNDVIQGRGGHDLLNGADGFDQLFGDDGNDTLVGGTGSDFLFGGSGDDLFVFAAGDGNDAIGDFTAGAGSADVIDLRDFGFADFATFQAVIADDVSSSAVIDLGGGDRITLLGVSSATLDADDFLL